jgi:hypothetical protein
MIHSKTARLGALALLALAISACESLTEAAQRQPLSATLTGDSVKPAAISTSGTGSFSATLSYLNGQAALEYSLTFSELAGTATAVHLHGPSGADNVGDLLVDLAALPVGSGGAVTLGATTGTASGTLDLTVAVFPTVSGDSLHVLLDADLAYVDVHTSAHVGGEIRGQIRKR